MNDAENLHKLLSGANPALFRVVVNEMFGLSLPDCKQSDGKRKIRGSFSEVLAFLPVSQRLEIDAWAEQINTLTDGPGKDAIKSVRIEQLPEEQHELFDQIGNQYDRSLWLNVNAPSLFNEAINIRYVYVFRQSTACCSGFVGPKQLPIKAHQGAIESFRKKVANHFHCSDDQVAVDIFQRMNPSAESEQDISLYQINIHHNLAPEAVECVKQKQLDSEQVTRAASTFVTYEPSTGHIDVYSKDPKGRDLLACSAADCLLESPIDGERIQLKQYSYQFLGSPYNLDIGGEAIEWVKVTRLGYAKGPRVLDYRIGTRNTEDIHKSAAQDIHPQFSFSSHRLTMAYITVRIRKQPGERARTVNIVLRGDNGCNIKTKREKDRILCDRLLYKWGIVREVGNDCAAAANDA